MRGILHFSFIYFSGQSTTVAYVIELDNELDGDVINGDSLESKHSNEEEKDGSVESVAEAFGYCPLPCLGLIDFIDR